eukprot:3382223-Rhodomonas_salina.3
MARPLLGSATPGGRRPANATYAVLGSVALMTMALVAWNTQGSRVELADVTVHSRIAFALSSGCLCYAAATHYSTSASVHNLVTSQGGCCHSMSSGVAGDLAGQCVLFLTTLEFVQVPVSSNSFPSYYAASAAP